MRHDARSAQILHQPTEANNEKWVKPILFVQRKEAIAYAFEYTPIAGEFRSVTFQADEHVTLRQMQNKLQRKRF